MKIIRQNNYSYHEAISGFIRKKGRDLNSLEQARVTDALEGKIERKRRRQARRAKNVGKAKVSVLGAEGGSTRNEKALENAAQRIANQDTFNRQEEEIIVKNAKKIKI